ncbi:hypothetical protein DICPUDRAFT_158926 [Dictyostelium purpureum]|uniref:RING-type E3 ubiquitin transferase n=1 Tax=Dictyostelium purpureum TaxID=5786 RepID=F1A2U6_DICPU|nr:uncharacterized protein DICPUDRAFT_158926 [Dictyostelium purpureum]EGC29479.1 hypothetical protein DICPUDRAFT_158926 [Dictyostelium purpureum]|eukprot:XP_003293988.1 hypothetical protein DICPUDRAFT_158926 [Dictyostelium purpureum]
MNSSQNDDYYYNEDDDEDFYYSINQKKDQGVTNERDFETSSNSGDIEKKEDERLEEEEEEEEEKPVLVSEDSTCPICLGPFDDLTFLDICFHQFCFLCILQWSEVNQKCPLCKNIFHSFIYKVKSNTDYQRYIIENKSKPDKTTTTITTTTTNSTNSNNYNQQQANIRRFNNSHNNNNENYNSNFNNNNRLVFLPTLSITEQHSFRKSVYVKNIKAIPMVPPFKLYLDPISISASFKTWQKKLKPWIKRELQSILQTSDTDILEDLVLEILKKYNIVHDEKVYETLSKYLFDKTLHFIHELLCFATSPYNMQTYDLKVIYDKRQSLVNTINNNNNNNNNSNSNSNNNINNNIKEENQTNDTQNKIEPLSNILQSTNSPIKHIPPFLSNILAEEKERQDEEKEMALKRKLEEEEQDNIKKIMKLEEPDFNKLQQTILNDNSTDPKQLIDYLDTKISDYQYYISQLENYKSKNDNNDINNKKKTL